MIESISQSPLYRIANPESLAFFGASDNFSSMGTTLLANIISMGFKGPVYPIHPSKKSVQGLPAYAGALDLPVPPDLAVIVVPAAAVAGVVSDCGRRGIRHAIVVTGGFAEVGAGGAALQKELKGIAAQYGLRFLGPNCLGVMNTRHGLNTTFLEHEGVAGFIGLASQSGSFITHPVQQMRRLGLGFSTALSVGNEADLDIVDCLEYLGVCSHTKVIALYIEGIRRGRDFVRVAREVALRKPIVAMYAGGTTSGSRAVLSHTGALAGPDALYEGIFRQSGIVRASSISQMMDFCWALGTQPGPESPRVAVQTHSGGPGAVAADAAERAGLDLPGFSEKTRQRLAPLLSATATLQNPVDLTFYKNAGDFFDAIPRAILSDEKVDGMLLYLLMTPKMVERFLRQMGVPEQQASAETRRMLDDQCEIFARVAGNSGKPVVGYSFRGLEEPVEGGMAARGIPVFPDAERAARAMAALVSYAALVRKIVRAGNSS